MGNLLSGEKAAEKEEQKEEEPVSAFQQLQMEEEVLAWILEGDEIFSARQEELEEAGKAWEFARAVDYPQIPGHLYWEGYAHCKPEEGAIDSMNPRWGHSMAKQPGPQRIVAFLRAFKRLNSGWMERAFAGHPPMQELVEQELHLCDLAMQVHVGDEVAGDNLGWHFDGPNSALHCAISVRGKRVLHHRDPLTGRASREPQRAGFVYVGTPFTERHAVEYPQSTWEERVIAVQARFLFPDTKKWTRPNFEAMMRQVARVIRDADIIMPTLEQVKGTIHQ